MAGRDHRHLANLRAAALFMLFPAFLFVVMAVMGGGLSFFSFAQISFIAWGTSTAAVWLIAALLPRWFGPEGRLTVSRPCPSCGRKQFVLVKRCFDCRLKMGLPLKELPTVAAILVGVGVYFVIMMEFGERF